MTTAVASQAKLRLFVFKMDHMITAIKVQQRNPQRVSIDLDGEFAFGVSRILAAWLHVGKTLSDADIAQLQAKETLEVAYLAALRFIDYRPRTTTEIENKLTEKGFAEAVIQATLERLRANGMLDDNHFAQTWVENQSTFRPRGSRALAFELRRKGVADEVIAQTLEELPPEEELAYQAGKKQARKLVNLERNLFRNKLSAFLARRGFSYGTITPVVSRIWTELHSPESQDDNLQERGVET
jgi:regulatory protein